MDKVAIFAVVKAKPGKRDELRRLYEEHIKPHAESNASQQMCFYCYGNDDEDRICIFELFSDMEAVKTNMDSDWLPAYMEKELPFLAEPPQIMMTTPVWIKGATGQ